MYSQIGISYPSDANTNYYHLDNLVNVKKGDLIMSSTYSFHIDPIKYIEADEKDYYAEQDGYLWLCRATRDYRTFDDFTLFTYHNDKHIIDYANNGCINKEEVELFRIYDTLDDLYKGIDDYVYPKITRDLTSDDIQVDMDNEILCINNSHDYSISRFEMGFRYINGNLKLTISISPKGSRYLTRIQNNDQLTLLLDNGYVITIPFEEKRGFVIYLEDFNSLTKHRILKIQIKYSYSKAIDEFDCLDDGWCTTSFILYANCISNFFRNNNILVAKKEETESYQYDSSPCYVYLMVDKNTGYYKIGISKHPKYREGTLQSEKPTIEMLACKQYPDRKIAVAIEKALHNAYSEYHIRGEWFAMTQNDVKNLLASLS